MAQAKRKGFGARSVGFSVAAILAVALFSAAGVARAVTCTECTFSPDAGAIATGTADSGFGYDALNSDTGGANTAIGFVALELDDGFGNTAVGAHALFSNTTGTGNIAVGVNAGDDLTTGSGNIDIGSEGVAGESNTIRIGGVIGCGEGCTQGPQTATYVAGVYGTALTITTALPVLIDSSGHLGTAFTLPHIPGPVFPFPSSARYKRDIHDMGEASRGLMKLRPVSFRYKQDPAGTLQYGLIGEEVERVYPELVTHGADGKVEGVRYELLPALLLNEVQRQARKKDAQIAALRRQVASQEKQIDALKTKDAQIDALAERMNALEQQVRLARPEHLAGTMR